LEAAASQSRNDLSKSELVPSGQFSRRVQDVVVNVQGRSNTLKVMHGCIKHNIIAEKLHRKKLQN
jgi:hypothetical protein